MRDFKIDVYGLDSRERAKLTKTLKKEIHPEGYNITVTAQVLQRSQLKGCKLDSKSGSKVNMIVLCHFNEGRVLLTDQDGLYNDFIKEAVNVTSGNVFIALSGVQTEGNLANAETVTALVKHGNQESMNQIHSHGRFLTWDRQPSNHHLNHITSAVQGRIGSLNCPEGILRHCFRKKVAMMFCVLI